jgi:hypothetical protein
VTVSLSTPTNRAVGRVPFPSRRCSKTAKDFSSGNFDCSSTVPLRSEKCALQVRQ